MIKAIETRYAGCRFRSRLEARWAVFFDDMQIPWEYEPQGFTLGDGRNYLPDFLLPQCGTWIEVKGSVVNLDPSLIEQAVIDLPKMPSQGEHGPHFMLLGPIPPHQEEGDYGWCALEADESGISSSCYGFGPYRKNHRPWWMDSSGCTWSNGDESCLTPFYCDHEGSPGHPQLAYDAARSARFEHGESGHPGVQPHRWDVVDDRWEYSVCRRCPHIGYEHSGPDFGGCDKCQCPEFVDP